MSGKFRRVRKEDIERIVLTETCPYEVPLIFSNFNFYRILKKISQSNSRASFVYKHIFSKKLNEHTIPLSFSIRKNSHSFRHLSLIHPASQVELIEFYRSFNHQILVSCKKSKFSIRAPNKVASKYYFKNKKDSLKEFRTTDISNTSDEKRYKHLTSYFSYRGHTRLYKFFESKDFIDLERKYSFFWSLDINKCFDSIYSHSISWALKTKQYSKKHKNIQNTFEFYFDRLMQAMNYNETSGIVIGPEVSRIFAETILQQVDQDIEINLAKEGLYFSRDYDIRRYVDDYYIFTSNETTCQVVTNTIEDCLQQYKLSYNSNKFLKLQRPFITQETIALKKTKGSISKLINTAITINELDGKKSWEPNRIKNTHKLSVEFINDIKSFCINDPAAYELCSNFVITSLSNTIIRFTKTTPNNEKKKDNPSSYEKFFFTFLNIIFHFFTVSPTHKGSINVCKITYASCNFYKTYFPTEENVIKSFIYTSCINFLDSSSFTKIASTTKDTPLEILNIIISMSLLGKNFLLSRENIDKATNYSEKSSLSYFEIITLLFYTKDFSPYLSIRSKISKSICHQLKNLSDIRENSAKAHLLLDIISCPYVERKTKKRFTSEILKKINETKPNDEEVGLVIDEIEANSCFTNWDEVALVNILEKKELLVGY